MGEMELYVRWLDKHEAGADEDSRSSAGSYGGEEGEEQIELPQLDRSGIRVESYLTELPPKEAGREKLKAVAEAARGHFTLRDADE